MDRGHPFFVQLSDTHLFADPQASLWDVEPDSMLDLTLAELARIDGKPQFVLVTGDCSSDGSLESYRRLADKLRFDVPVWYLPGNHDDAGAMAQLFAGRALADDDNLSQAFEACGWRFILLDSSVPGQEAGAIGRSQLEWLKRELSNLAALPAVVAVHHQPVPIGSQWLDDMGISDAADLLAVLDRSPQVRAVLFGHVHQDFQSYRGGTLYCSAPSTFFQFKPNWPVFAKDDRRPGARIVRLSNGAISTSVIRTSATADRR